ncbi:zf-HC2 domain-containing protein [Promicromonospora sp. CA-289599]|uniref:zf-HC2 domain-containing protein n=1 Tax=Promicromonospora sp. CA-289599 TaxID=3240014 RepID=UPI003D8E28FB
MTAARALRIDDWVVHRPNVVRSVAARVPGIDAEEAASRALEKMVRIVSTGRTIDDPAPYWRRAAVNEAISMTREAGRAHPVEDDTLDGLTPPVAGAELDAERHADVAMLRTALSDLADDDRQILLERHVHDRAVTDIATNLGVRPHAVTMRLRRAEERLAGAFAAAHAQGVNEPECRTTRAAMHDYLKDRLLPRRRTRFEAHMDGCAECTRAFVDVREVSWMLRDLGQHVIAGAIATGALGAAVGGAAAGAAGGAAGAGAAGAGAPRPFGKKETAIAAGVLAALALGGGAAALVANQPADPPAAESAPIPGAGGGGGAGEGGAGGGGAGAGTGAGGEGAGGGGAGGGAGADGTDDAGEGGDAGEGAGNVGDGSSTDDDGSGGGADAGDGGGDTGAGNGAGGSGDTGSGGSDSANGTNSSPEGGPGSDSPPGTNRSEGDGAEGGDAEGGDGSGTADDTLPDIGATVTDWLAGLGIGGEPSDGQNGGSGSLGTGSADGSDASGSDTDGTDAGGNGSGSDEAGGGPAAGGDPDTSGRDGTGTTTADGADTGIGAEVTNWLGKLGAVGIPGFLLIVLILWLWERWTRAEES